MEKHRLIRLPGITQLEAAAIQTQYKTPGELYRTLQSEKSKLENEVWYPENKEPEALLDSLEEVYSEDQLTIEHGDDRESLLEQFPDPRYEPGYNEHFEGSVMLEDEDYVIPVRAPFSVITDILKGRAVELDDVFADSRPEFVELAPSKSLQKYRLVPYPRENGDLEGSSVVWSELEILDRGSCEVVESFCVSELADLDPVDKR